MKRWIYIAVGNPGTVFFYTMRLRNILYVCKKHIYIYMYMILILMINSILDISVPSISMFMDSVPKGLKPVLGITSALNHSSLLVLSP